jgi:hypothetical protein
MRGTGGLSVASGLARLGHVPPPAGLTVRSYYRREERVDVEQNEVLVVPDSDRTHQSRIDPRQVGSRRDGVLGNLEEVHDLGDPQPVAAAGDLYDHDRTLVPRLPLLLEEDVAVENGEEGAPDVDEPFDRLADTRDPGGREARQDLTHDPCRGSANQRTDPKDDGV